MQSLFLIDLFANFDRNLLFIKECVPTFDELGSRVTIFAKVMVKP
jgi:hypothetical protein